MRKKTKRQDGGLMSPEEMAIAIEAFQQRRAERMGAEPDIGPAAVDNEDPDAVGAAVDNEEPDVANELDTVQMVKDRRDRRDAEGDPEDVEGAMGIIAQQDEDIDTLLGVIDVLTGPDGGVLLVDDADEENTDADEENTDEDEENTDEGEEENSDEEENPVRSDRRDARDDFREMLRVVRIGDRLHMDGLETLSVKSAKKAILKKLKPSLRLDGKSSAYVNAAFDMAVNDLKTRKDTNYQRKQMTSRRDSTNTRKAVGSAMDARQRMIDKRMKKEDK